MALDLIKCRKCTSYPIRDDDRFCGHCGTPLAALEFEQGGQISIPPDASGQLEVSIAVSNKGSVPCDLTIDTAGVENTVEFLGPRTAIRLLPLETEPLQLRFRVNADRLKERDQKVVRVGFTSEAASIPHGEICVAVAEPGEVLAEPGSIKITEEVRIVSENSPHDGGSRFKVSLRNTGGERVGVQLRAMSTHEAIRVVPVTDPDDVWKQWLNAYQSAEFEFLALPNPGGQPGSFKVKMEFDVRKKYVPVELQGTVVVVPVPVCDPDPVDFDIVMPGEVVVLDVNIRVAGVGSFNVVDFHSELPYVRILPKPKPFPVTKDGNPIALAFSTRWAGNRSFSDNLEGNVILETSMDVPLAASHRCKIWPWGTSCQDVASTREIHLRWKARIQHPPKVPGFLAVDFGTVNSCAAYFDGGGDPQIVADTNPVAADQGLGASSGIIPSVLVFVDKGVFVTGQRAVDRAPGSDEKDIVRNIKRCIVGPDRTIRGVKYSPTKLASLMIEQLLLKPARLRRAMPAQIVMTVPADFTGPRRKNMVQACVLACGQAWPGLTEEDLPPIDEPTAAAMSYAYKRGSQLVSDDSPTHDILVFDFGGGTLDISIVRFSRNSDNPIDVRPVIARGDNFMGGIDIDYALLCAMADRAAGQVPLFYCQAIKWTRPEFFALRDNANDPSPFTAFEISRKEWYERSHRTKEALSFVERDQGVEFVIPVLLDAQGKPVLDDKNKTVGFSYHLKRSEFEEMIRARVDKALHLVASARKSADAICPNIRIKTVLLTGQSSRIPIFRERIRAEFPGAHIPEETEMPMKTSVAAGAAIAAYFMSLGGDGYRVHNLEGMSYRYGYLTGQGNQLAFVELIPLGKPFAEAYGRVETDQGKLPKILRIVQNGSMGNVFDGDLEKSPDITELGQVYVPKACRELGVSRNQQFTLELGFSDRNGSIAVKIGGQPVSCTPPGSEEETDFVYL